MILKLLTLAKIIDILNRYNVLSPLLLSAQPKPTAEPMDIPEARFAWAIMFIKTTKHIPAITLEQLTQVVLIQPLLN